MVRITKQFPSACDIDEGLCDLGQGFMVFSECNDDPALAIEGWTVGIAECSFNTEDFSKQEFMESYKNKFSIDDPEYMLILNDYCTTFPSYPDCQMLSNFCEVQANHYSCTASGNIWKIIVIASIIALMIIYLNKKHAK
jgi:hypothetical protein